MSDHIPELGDDRTGHAPEPPVPPAPPLPYAVLPVLVADFDMEFVERCWAATVECRDA